VYPVEEEETSNVRHINTVVNVKGGKKYCTYPAKSMLILVDRTMSKK
jgi:hypothetical protein